MGEFVFFGLILGTLIVVSLVLPWINMGRINSLRREIGTLRMQLQALREFLEKKNISVPREILAPKPIYAPDEFTDLVEAYKSVPPVTAPAAAPLVATVTEAVPAASAPPEAPVPPVPPRPAWHEGFKFEENIGAKLPVWIGGVALALAGFFLVKYSIDNNLLSPAVRCGAGLLFGFGLLAAGNWVRARPGIADGARIGQAITGAGLADLYVSIYAATTLYQLIPATAGFAGLAAVTAAAVILSLRHGMPIAIIGMLGGFLTPAMVSTNHPQAAPLFIYLYFVMTGLFAVIRRERWWVLSIPVVFFAFLWVLIWLFGGYFVPGELDDPGPVPDRR